MLKNKKDQSEDPDEEDFSLYEVDPDKLDEECMGQAVRYAKEARLLAKARRQYAEAKSQLKLVTAQLRLEIKNKPKGFGLQRPTKEAADAIVDTSEIIQKASRRVIVTAYKVDLLEASCRALEHRKKAIEDAIYLWACGYFAEPKVEDAKAVRQRISDRKTQRRPRLHE